MRATTWALAAIAAVWSGTATAQQPPMSEDLAWKLLELGRVIDVPRTAALYAPMQQKEPYEGVKTERDVKYGPAERHLLDVFTPETNNSIHYWWFNSRDYRPEDAEIDRFMFEAHSQAYHEDLEALEWINEVVRNDGEAQFDLSFAPDKPGLMARRIMYRLAMKEAR